ncbi:NAD synthetase [Lysinibacillus sp. FSL H8-0500]|uniref:NAD synthetase n=1 Tax=Lysinibacillus sp. FSL H8-0500 TaxID=2921393 RepID=UPI0031018A39
MRTSRIDATTSSVFRQENQYLHAGDISHNFGQSQQQSFKNNLQKNKAKKYSAIATSKPQQSTRHIAFAPTESNNNLRIRHELNETALKLSHISNQKKRLNSYQSSI